MGLIVVKFLSLEEKDNQLVLKVGGIDLLDNTPIVDIKPYVPYADKIEGVSSSWVPNPEDIFTPKIIWNDGIKEKVSLKEAVLIEKVLEQGPRHSAQKKDKDSYVFNLFDYEIRFDNGPEEFLNTPIIKSNT